jgi:hypothetical protein
VKQRPDGRPEHPGFSVVLPVTMSLRSLILAPFLLACTLGMAQKAKRAAVELPGCPVDTSKYVIFGFANGLEPIVNRKVVLFDAVPQQIDQAECILRAYQRRCAVGGQDLLDSLAHLGTGHVSSRLNEIDLDSSLRQYMGGTDSKGQVLIYLNGLCPGESRIWRSKWVPVKGSGPCSFRAVVNLTSGTIEVLRVHDKQ